MRDRTRSWRASAGQGVATKRKFSGVTGWGPLTYTTWDPGTVCSQHTLDNIHDWPNGRSSGRDVGGSFVSTTKSVEYNAPKISAYAYYNGDEWTYNGPCLASIDDWPTVGSITAGTESQLKAAGTTAIARTVPTSPPANVSVMLGELFREGVPKAAGATLLKSRFRDYRDYGSEYLNYEFGWKPIAADLKSVARTMIESERILDQLERDSGRNVRRKFAFPTANTTSNDSSTLTKYSKVIGLPQGSAIWGTNSWSIRGSHERRRWFSGCYTYHFKRPTAHANAMRGAVQKARVLYGLDLTPEVVWNLAPWSWLADWVSNAGDVMSNMSRFSRDDLVMRYGYIMEHSKNVHVHTLNNISYSLVDNGSKRAVVSPSTTYTRETKQRYPATPFGFGLTESGFDTSQWAILGALGISRGPRTL